LNNLLDLRFPRRQLRTLRRENRTWSADSDQREVHVKCGAFSLFAFHDDRAAVLGHDPLGNR